MRWGAFEQNLALLSNYRQREMHDVWRFGDGVNAGHCSEGGDLLDFAFCGIDDVDDLLRVSPERRGIFGLVEHVDHANIDHDIGIVQLLLERFHHIASFAMSRNLMGAQFRLPPLTIVPLLAARTKRLCRSNCRVIRLRSSNRRQSVGNRHGQSEAQKRARQPFRHFHDVPLFTHQTRARQRPCAWSDVTITYYTHALDAVKIAPPQ